MSRSYKKTPISKWTTRYARTLANRTIRRKINRGEEIGEHCAYRKHYQTWDVCDNVWRQTWEEYEKWVEKSSTPCDWDKWYRRWRKYHYNK